MRMFPRKRTLMAGLGFLAAGATAAIAVPSNAQAAGWNAHHIMVMAPSSAHSVFYITSTTTQPNFTTCRTISDHPNGRWVDGRMDVYNGAPIQMITFSSANCTTGYIKSTGRLTAPTTNMTNWWVNLR
jgi:hypothetical protein